MLVIVIAYRCRAPLARKQPRQHDVTLLHRGGEYAAQEHMPTYIRCVRNEQASSNHHYFLARMALHVWHRKSQAIREGAAGEQFLDNGTCYKGVRKQSKYLMGLSGDVGDDGPLIPSSLISRQSHPSHSEEKVLVRGWPSKTCS